MSQHSTTEQRYLDAMATAGKRMPARMPARIRALQAQAASRFGEVGFPAARGEGWKYTDVGPIARADFTPAPKGLNGIDIAGLEGFLFKDLNCHRLVLVNGYYAPALSRLGRLPAGVTVSGLAEALTERPEALEAYLGRCLPEASHGFTALNTALLADGAFIHLARGVSLEQPVHILHLITDEAESMLVQPRNLVVAEANTQATLIEHYAASGEAAYWTNTLTEVVAEANASLTHYRLQEEGLKAFHVGGLHVHLDRDSRFTSFEIDFGGRLVRNELRSVLDAEGAECWLNGLSALGGRQHVDNHTYIDHASPRGTSREFYKGILDGRARGVFHGRIVVHPHAQHSDAEQLNHNLLLSRDAEADSKPQLEIYADDVKCSHGATVGQLDADALFYLRSRAMDEAAARDVLTYAFARDVLQRIGLEPLRLWLERRLASGLLHGRDIRQLELE